MRLGLIVIIVLAILTVIEYAVAVGMERGSWPYLAAMALAKAGLIAWYFMHMAQIWGKEE